MFGNGAIVLGEPMDRWPSDGVGWLLSAPWSADLGSDTVGQSVWTRHSRPILERGGEPTMEATRSANLGATRSANLWRRRGRPILCGRDAVGRSAGGRSWCDAVSRLWDCMLTRRIWRAIDSGLSGDARPRDARSSMSAARSAGFECDTGGRLWTRRGWPTLGATQSASAASWYGNLERHLPRAARSCLSSPPE